MSKYIDGYVLPVSKDKLPAYKKMAQAAGKVWKKHGALEYLECVGDDLTPDMGGVKSIRFPQAVKAKGSEVVIFSYIVFKSRAHRDKVNALVMKDPFMNDSKYENMPMPFDMRRMIYGGFKAIVGF